MKTHREQVTERLGLPASGNSLILLASRSRVPLNILREVYNRGIGAYKTQPTSVRMKGTFEKGGSAPMSQRLSKEQWAYARVYSFLNTMNGKLKHDTDLRDKLRSY